MGDPDTREDAPDLLATRQERLRYILTKNRAAQAWLRSEHDRLVTLFTDGHGEGAENPRDLAALLKTLSSEGQTLFRGINDEAKYLGVDKVKEGEDVGKKAAELGGWLRLKVQCPRCKAEFRVSEGGEADGQARRS